MHLCAAGHPRIRLAEQKIDRQLPSIFDTLLEAKGRIERWRVEYNTIRPPSALGYRPAPETLQERKSNLAMLGWTSSPEDAEELT